jgi:hypothetical protein
MTNGQTKHITFSESSPFRKKSEKVRTCKNDADVDDPVVGRSNMRMDERGKYQGNNDKTLDRKFAEKWHK